VNKAVCVSRADGLFVEAHRFNIAAVDPRDLGPDQCGAVLENCPAIAAHSLKLLVMRSDSVQVLLAIVGANAPGAWYVPRRGPHRKGAARVSAA